MKPIYGCVKAIPVAEIVAYMPVGERVLAFQNKAYGSVSGAAVNTDTEEEEYVDGSFIPGISS